MRKYSKLIIIIMSLSALAACGPKDVQPIQSLSGITAEQMHVADVKIGLGSQFEEYYAKKIGKEEEIVKSQRDRIAGLSEERTRRNKINRDAAEKNIEEAETKIARLQEEMSAIPVDLEAAVRTALENKFAGSRGVNLDVTVDSMTLTNGAVVVIFGGSDSMTGTFRIKDAQSDALLGEYHITNFDTNGGLIGAMARGSNVRGQMFREFSNKISGILAGEYADE